MLSSQDNLDGGPRSPSASLQSPPSDHSTFSPTLSEVHAHLIRSPPPISWPMQAHERRYYPVSPRSTGTFSPDSSDGLELVNPPIVRETASRRQSHTFFHLLPKPGTYFYVHLMDGAARIFPYSYAATGNQTHVSRVAPDWVL